MLVFDVSGSGEPGRFLVCRWCGSGEPKSLLVLRSYGSGEPAAPRRQSLLRSCLAARSLPRRPPAYFKNPQPLRRPEALG